MVESCCAFNCTNRRPRRTNGVKMKFHRIPKDPNLRQMWLLAITRVAFITSETTVIYCEKHFNLEDYEYRLAAFVYNILLYSKYICISVVTWISIITITPIFVVYRKLIDIILKVKYENQYGGLLDKSDCFFLKSNLSMSCTITCVFIVKTENEKNIYNDVRLSAQEKVFDEPNLYPKLSHSINNFGGYAYLLNNNSGVDDAIKLMAVPSNVLFDEEYLKIITAEINSSELSLSNSLLWYAYVSEKPLENQANDNFYRYPIIFRFHHAVGDGTSIVALFIRLFGNESSQNYSENLFKKLFKTKNSKPDKIRTYTYYLLLKMFKVIKFWLTVIFISIGRVQNKNLFGPANKNALHSTNLSGEKIVAWATEDYPECIDMVKNVKKHVSNTTFSRIVATALSNSMTSFFKRNSLPVPDYTTGLMIILLKYPDIVSSKPVPLDNKSTLLQFDLPSTNQTKSLLSELENVNRQMESQLSYEDALVVRFLSAELFGYLPINLANELLGLRKQTFILTNVPGGSEIEILDGCVIEKIIPIAPNLRYAAVTFALLTYDDRFQIGFLVDKALINSQVEAQKMVDDILESIKVLDKESHLELIV